MDSNYSIFNLNIIVYFFFTSSTLNIDLKRYYHIYLLIGDNVSFIILLLWSVFHSIVFSVCHCFVNISSTYQFTIFYLFCLSFLEQTHIPYFPIKRTKRPECSSSDAARNGAITRLSCLGIYNKTYGSIFRSCLNCLSVLNLLPFGCPRL